MGSRFSRALHVRTRRLAGRISSAGRKIGVATVAVVMTFSMTIAPVQPAMAVIASDSGSTADSAALGRLERARERMDRRVTQDQREAAAEQMADMLAETGSDGVTALDEVSAAAMEMTMTGEPPDYFGMTPNWAYSPGIRKFVDGLPGLGAENANNLGQYLAVAHPDTTTYPGSDYYEIELREYTEQLHSDLPETLLRGYVQTNKGTDEFGNNTIKPDPIHYLGPTIFATKDRPVRVKFTNALPTGEGGDLFLPVDRTYMGAGMGPEGGMYTTNRASVHLHGGKTVWISDGTPHQWITPAGEETTYPVGVSVTDVPDMPDPGDGSTTFFYSNQQSARMLWYHDHAYGITRLTVYSGQAAGYFITDDTEQELITEGLLPEEQIPLIIQDKTFTDAETIGETDPLWRWGSMPGMATTGDLWFPHVYMPAQNPAMPDGIAPMGRWHYGPWFWPPTPVPFGPIPNPLYDPVNAPWQYELMPGTPFDSSGMEAFQDTPMINGTPYPVLEVDPKAYRFRILNAASDRFWNLQLYEADPAAITCDGRRNTEVEHVDAAPTAGWPEDWPIDGREGGVPDPADSGPDWIQVATEGGFLPQPAVFPNQPITWVTDVTMFNAGNVDKHTMLLGPAERADVVLDFSAYAGKTLILYNDAPAAFPAGDPRYDYYTNNPDMRDTGGHDSTKAGFGPNVRTIMQIKVAPIEPEPEFDLAALQAAFVSTDTQDGVFEKSQNPILIPDARYNTTYNESFPIDQYVRIYQQEHTFTTLDSTVVTFPLEPKAIQDEQGETYDDYGRMAGNLGLERPTNVPGAPNFILYGFQDPATEVLSAVEYGMEAMSPVLGDGTQIWKITHNGVDTHPMHFHLYDVQLINRVGWDGFLRYPDDNELGWKDTVRVSPLEDTIVALRPAAPTAPFNVPDSKRLLDPTMPPGETMGFSKVDPSTGEPYLVPVVNEVRDFDWEYVWHCHILSHEEMDMMRPVTVEVSSTIPATPTVDGALVAPGASGLTWSDATPGDAPATWGDISNEIGFRIERASLDASGNPGPYAEIAGALANQTSYDDPLIALGESYGYRVIAYNEAGESTSTMFAVGPVTDGTPPVTTSNVGTVWHNDPFMASLSATDTLSGVESTHYSLDGAAVTTYTAAFQVAGDGVHSLDFYSVDASGNTEPTNSESVMIDDTAPVTTDNHVATYAGSASIALTPTDAASGVASTSYMLDGDPVAVGTTVQTSVLGMHTLAYWSTDEVGNIESAHYVEFDVEPAPTAFETLGGPNRIATALEISTASFPLNSVDTVVIASSSAWSDALVGSSLAGAYRSPILLTKPTSLDAGVVSEIERLGASKAVVLGGTAALGTDVENALKAILGNANVTRLGGSSRYSTARLVAEKTAEVMGCAYDGTAFVATGRDFPDAMAVGPLSSAKAWPILLVNSADLGAANADTMNAIGVDEVLIAGGTAAVPMGVEDDITADVGAPITRLAGSNRYRTAIAVAEYGVNTVGLSWNGMALATGLQFPDGLAAGAAQGALGSVVLLTPTATLNTSVAGVLTAHKDEIVDFRFIGGDAAISPAVRAQVQALLN